MYVGNLEMNNWRSPRSVFKLRHNAIILIMTFYVRRFQFGTAFLAFPKTSVFSKSIIGIGKIKNNPQVYTTQEGMQEIKNNPQVYTTQEGIGEIKNNPQVYTTQEGIGEIKITLWYTLPKRV